jgi:hypothetical protein
MKSNIGGDAATGQKLDMPLVGTRAPRNPVRILGAAEGCGSALQVDCLEGFDTPGLHQLCVGWVTNTESSRRTNYGLST